MKFNFADAIAAFNRMYKLPVASAPTIEVGVPVVERLHAFKKIMLEEIDEVDQIIAKLHGGSPTEAVLTDLADWLGDIQVYAASEMAKFGLPLHQVLEIIMNSNMSKLGADGLPIYDNRGKVQKGPNYWKPEPAIYALVTRLRTKAIFDNAEALKPPSHE